MANDKYLERMELAIERLHDCKAVHVDSVPVHEIVDGQTIWQGMVEVFNLIGHPQAKRCFAWPGREGPDGGQAKFVAVLEMPPVVSPETAVRDAIANGRGKSKSR